MKDTALIQEMQSQYNYAKLYQVWAKEATDAAEQRRLLRKMKIALDKYTTLKDLIDKRASN
jgi:hypothetical protein